MSDGLEKAQDPVKQEENPLAPAEQLTKINAEAAETARTTNIAGTKSPPPDIPGYAVLGVLGQGGMGVVFKAYDQRLLRNVAIKMVAAGPIAADELFERFEREAQAIAQIQHPNIAQIYEVGEVEGRPYLVMEFISGGTLSEHLRNQPQTPTQAAELIETLARAMHASHEAGILHRDLKPSNVLLTREGIPKITDFGLAKRLQAEGAANATRTGDVVGTPAYMSPEQAGGVVRSIGPPTDIYSLGVILFEMLTGRPPFQTPDPLSTVLMVLSDDPVPPRRLQPSVPRDLETICLKCLEKVPAKRYANAAELADDLGRFRRSEPIRARRIGIVERTLKFARRKPAVATSIVLILLSIAVISGMWIHYTIRLRSELARTNRLFNRAHDLANFLLLKHSNAVSKLRGSTTAEKELVQQMLVYLDALSNERHEGEIVTGDIMEEDLAAAYERIAAIQGSPYQHNVGESNEALKSYQKALVIRKRLATAHSKDLFAQLAHVSLLVKMADIHAAQGAPQKALTQYQDAEKRFQALRDSFKSQQSILSAQSDLQLRIADVYFEQNKVDESLARFNRALNIAQEASEGQPKESSWQRRLAVIHSRIAQALQAQKKDDEAQKHFEVMLKYAQSATAAAPLDAEAERDLTVAMIGYADSLFHEGKVEDATTSYTQAVQLRRVHRDADPQSATIAWDLAVALERLGIAQQLQQKLDDAANSFQEALVLATTLQQQDTENISLLREVCALHDRLGGVLRVQGKFQEANEQLRKGLDLGRQLLAKPDPSPADLEVMAELNFSWAGVQIGLLSPEDSNEQVEQRFTDAIKANTQALELFDRMKKLAPLTPRQQGLYDQIENARRHLEENLKRLRELPKDTSNC